MQLKISIGAKIKSLSALSYSYSPSFFWDLEAYSTPILWF